MNATEKGILEYLNKAKEEYLNEVRVLRLTESHIARFSKHQKLSKKIEGDIVDRFSLRVPSPDKWSNGETREVKVAGWTNKYTEIFYAYSVPVAGWYPYLVDKLGQTIQARLRAVDEIQNTIAAIPALEAIEKDIADFLESKREIVPCNLYRTTETLRAFPLALDSRL